MNQDKFEPPHSPKEEITLIKLASESALRLGLLYAKEDHLNYLRMQDAVILISQIIRSRKAKRFDQSNAGGKSDGIIS